MSDTTQKWLVRFGAWLLRRRIFILILIFITAGVSGYFYNKIPRDPSVEAMVLEDDPDLVAYRRFKDLFGNDEYLLMVAKVPDIFDRQVMQDVEALRANGEALPHVKEAIAYTNARTVRGEDDSVVVEKLIPRIPDTDEEMAATKKMALADVDYVGSLYSPDASTMAIAAPLRTLPKELDTTDTRTEITRGARGLIEQAPFNKYAWHIAGVPVLKSDLVEVQKAESRKFEAISFAVVVLALFVMVRSLAGVIGTIISVVTSITLLMAIHYFSGIPLTMVSTILVPLLLVYGISPSIHFQTHYAIHGLRLKDKRKALLAAFSITFIACFFNSLTTTVGFGSNMVSGIKPIREFALFASSGVMLSFLLAYLVVPTVLSFGPPPGKALQKANESGFRAHFIEWVIRLINRRWKAILVFNAIVLVLSIYGMSLIKVETRLLDYFRPETPIRSSYDFIEKNLSGTSTLEMLIDTGAADGMKDPAIIAKLEELNQYIDTREPGLTSVLSLVNYYKRMNRALNSDDPSHAALPASKQEAAQLLLLYTMDEAESDYDNFVSSDYRYGRLSARIRTVSSTELAALVKRVKAKTEELFNPLKARNVSVSVTGAAVLYANMNNSLMVGQFKSFGLSLLIISFMMILVAGQVRLGLVSLIPNLLPIAVTMGLMGYLGYPLDSSTAMISPIALGMAVDSTIHYMLRYRMEYQRLRDYRAAMEQSIRIIGRAMLGASLPLSAGFLVLTSSEFAPVYNFGVLSAVVVILAMLYDLLLTPICIWLYKPKYRSQGLLAKVLGEDEEDEEAAQTAV